MKIIITNCFALIAVLTVQLNKAFAQQRKTTAKATTASEIIQSVPDKAYNGLQPRSLAPDVVKIDADEISDIVNGVCIVKKGNQQGLIDLKGNFIIPWTDCTLESSTPFSTLININFPSIATGFINVKGEYVIPLQYKSLGKYDFEGTASARANGIDFYIDKKGNKMPANVHARYNNLAARELFNKPQSDLLPFASYNIPYGFVNKAGKTAIPPTYKIAKEFTDGLAAVQNIDQFGKSKWGFINATGKIVIPYSFSNEPGYFHEGLALVVPVEQAEFSFAYIDKTGQVQIKVSNGKQVQPYHPAVEDITKYAGSNGSPFFHNYAVWQYGNRDYRILDKAGKMHLVQEICTSPDIAKQELLLDKYDDLGLYFYTTKGGYYANTHGLMDWDGNILFPPAFTKVKADYYSNYAYAEIELAGGVNNSTVITKGIVNKQGVFVLVLQKSKSVF